MANEPITSPNRSDYGQDAPSVVRYMALASLAALAITLALAFDRAPRMRFFMANAVMAAILMLICMGVMVWSSRVGKFAQRDRVLGAIDWRGTEEVLDVGCGRGLALIGAAKRLTTGHAAGVDIWSQVDLSTNSVEALMANARAEGVTDRVRAETADARKLPFDDQAFDVVLSMTALHNIRGAHERRRALAEIVRVLKPGGRLSLFDIHHVGAYRRDLNALGMVNVRISGLILLWLVPGRRLVADRP